MNPISDPRRLLLAATLWVTALMGVAAADGFIIVHPPSPEIRVVPLWVKNHNVTVEIEGQVAVTTVDQVFHNPNAMQLEGTYIFPIPDGAGIENLSLWIDGVEQKAELLDADKARGIYEGIVRQMKDPALLEYVGRRAFKLRVFPIPASGDRRVKLSYRELLPAENGLARYLYPLNTEKFSSQPLESVLVDIKLSSPKPLGNILVLSHKAEIKKIDDTHARITYEAHNVVPDRDFFLHFSSTSKDFGLDVVAHRPAGEEGYALLALSPRQELDSEKIQPKDVVFVFDTSGSMHEGGRFKQASAALSYCVDTLRAGDRFEIINFSTEAHSLFSKLADVGDDSRRQAHSFIDKLEPLGGTNIEEALARAQGLNPKGDRPFMVVFLTDGQPTIGETTDVEEILKRASKRRTDNQRIFAFGVGNDVNTDLLDRLAGENSGARSYVGESQDIEVEVSNLWQKIASPVLTDVSLTTAGGATFSDSYPKKLPDLFHGVQLLVTTRYQGSGPTAIRLKGKLGADVKEYVFECTFPGSEAGNDYLPRLWAVRKVGYLLDEIHIHGENKELKDEVVRLSKKYGIMTPYTSYLVVEDRPTAAARPERNEWRAQMARTLRGASGFNSGDKESGGRDMDDGLRLAFKRQGQELERRAGEAPPAAAAGDGAGAPAPSSPLDAARGRRLGLPGAEEAEQARESLNSFSEAKAKKGLADESGELSVRASRFIDRLKDAGEVQDAASSFAGRLTGGIKQVGGLTFYSQGAGWVQAEVYDLEGAPQIVTVKAYSDEYFALLNQRADLAKVLSLGTSVCFLLEGKVYVITE